MSARFTRLSRTRRWTTAGHIGRRRVALLELEVALDNLARRSRTARAGRRTRGGTWERCSGLEGAPMSVAAIGRLGNRGSRAGTMRMALTG